MSVFDFYGILNRYSEVNNVQAFVIGAMDGVSHDTIKEFVSNKNWVIAFVEPVPEYFNKLIENFGLNDRFWYINKGVSDIDEYKEFVLFSPDKVDNIRVNNGMAGITTIFPPKNSMKGFMDSDEYKDVIEIRKFECVSVETLLDMVPFTKINYVQIDTEGYDWTILKQFDPKYIDFIKVEFYSMNESERQELFTMLEINDYEYYLNVEDVYAIKRKVLKQYATP